MRVLQSYCFLVGTKVPFDKLPGIVEEFLLDQNLTHRAFHYCLEDLDLSDSFRTVTDGTKCKTCHAPDFVCGRCRKEAADYLRRGTGCERAVQEHPFLGPIHVRQTRHNTIQSLHNFSDDSNDAKEKIYAVLSKIYRRYGFSHTFLIYRDIDFFSRRASPPAPEVDDLINSYDGSGITLYRSCISSDNAVTLTVESPYPGEVPDAAPYADALGKLLPGIKRLSASRIIMDEGETAYYDALHRRAEPLVARAKDFFRDRMPEEKGNEEPDAPVRVASWLKKLGKRYGYTYSGYINHLYFMEKKLPGGHYICLEFVSSPMSADADPYVSLCGLGFRHRIWADGFAPQNPRDASEYLSRLFEVLAEAEQTVLPAIVDLYPATPDWFLPTH